MWNSTLTQENSELGQLSALTFQLHSHTPASLPQSHGQLRHWQKACVSFHLTVLPLLPLLSAVHWGHSAWKGLLISISPLDTGPAMNLTRRKRGERLCSGKGDRKGRGGGWEGREGERNQPKKVREEGGGPEGGGGIEEGTDRDGVGALIQFGSFSYFSWPFSSVQSFVSAFRNALFDWQPVTDQLPPKAAWQREVTAQEGI